MRPIMKNESKSDEPMLPSTPTFDTVEHIHPSSKKSDKNEKCVMFSDEVDFESTLNMESTAERSNSGKKRKNFDIDDEVIITHDTVGENGRKRKKDKKKKKKQHRESHMDRTDDEVFGGFAERVANAYKNPFVETGCQVDNEKAGRGQLSYNLEDKVQESQNLQQDKAVATMNNTEKHTDRKFKEDKKHVSSGGIKNEEIVEQKQASKDNRAPIIRKETPIPVPKLLPTSLALKPESKKKSSFTEAFAAAKQRIASPGPLYVATEGYAPKVENSRESPKSAMLKYKLNRQIAEREDSLANQDAAQGSNISTWTPPVTRKVTPIPPPKLLYPSKNIILPANLNKKSPNPAILPGATLSTSENKPTAVSILPPQTATTTTKAKASIENNGSPHIAVTVDSESKLAHQFKSAEWETSSGTIRGRTSADALQRSENIAFSAQYIIPHANGISLGTARFQVIHLDPGKRYNLAAGYGDGVGDGYGPREMICSVANGRIEVRIEEMRFSIGEHGMWRVRGCEGCVMQNKGSEEAAVHITAFGDS